MTRGHVRSLRLALWQCAPVPREPATNLDRLRTVAGRAAEQGAQVLLTPEATLTGYDIGALDDGLVAGAVDQVVEVARETGIALVVGVLRRDAQGVWRNSAVLALPGDDPVVYDKAHLFGDLDRSRFVAGERTHGAAVIDGVPVATLVCYDVEHPEAVRSAVLDGARLVLVPTANMHPIAGVNDLLVPARALENGVPVAYANHCGQEAETRYLGRSLVAGPDGAVLARAGGAQEELLVVDVPVAIPVEAEGTPERDAADWGYLRDRRPELYGSLVAGRGTAGQATTDHRPSEER